MTIIYCEACQAKNSKSLFYCFCSLKVQNVSYQMTWFKSVRLMATLREVQYTLQEKIEQVRRRDRLIDELEDELLAREREISAMKREIRRYQNVVVKLTAINNTLRNSVKPGSTIVTSAPIIKAFENRPDFKAPKSPGNDSGAEFDQFPSLCTTV
uniref:Uncharacterized protein n=1 Tax=Romanomermis culicivorax TaxID=13658 RepID=A0A915L5K4_ROMCU